jgi:hypothetical protein
MLLALETVESILVGLGNAGKRTNVLCILGEQIRKLRDLPAMLTGFVTLNGHNFVQLCQVRVKRLDICPEFVVSHDAPILL